MSTRRSSYLCWWLRGKWINHHHHAKDPTWTAQTRGYTILFSGPCGHISAHCVVSRYTCKTIQPCHVMSDDISRWRATYCIFKAPRAAEVEWRVTHKTSAQRTVTTLFLNLTMAQPNQVSPVTSKPKSCRPWVKAFVHQKGLVRLPPTPKGRCSSGKT